jgi:hypothetical protein
MARRTGPIEAEVRRLVQAYITRHGHGAATTLGRAIHRSSAWVGMFIKDPPERHASVDEAVQLLALLDTNAAVTLLKDHAPKTGSLVGPVDPHEAQLLRLFYRLDDKQRLLLIDVARTMLRHRSQTTVATAEDHTAQG